MKPLLYFVLIALVTVSCNNKKQQTSSEPLSEKDSLALIAKAKEIHDRVITIDTHCDINVKNFTDSINYTQDLDTQVTLPKMEAGGLDVAWFIVYTGQDSLTPAGYEKAYKNAMAKFKAIHKLCKEIAPDRIELAYTSDDVKRIAATGKKVAMIGVENAYPIGTDLSNIKKFYDLGARYMSLSHNGHSQFCDSNTGEANNDWLHNGLSELGKQAIAEMNKLGMLIDVSHPSEEAMKQMVALTKAPLIASHSSARALCDHSRNLTDEQLLLIKENGGVVQTVAFASYLNTQKTQQLDSVKQQIGKAIMDSLGLPWKTRSEIMKMPTDERAAYFEHYMKMMKIRKEKMKTMKNLPPEVNVSDFVDHIDYMVNLIGIDHVGISSDFDGGGGIEGWSDASETFNVTLELVKRGYTEEEIRKLWGENLLRVLDKAQEVALQLQKEKE